MTLAHQNKMLIIFFYIILIVFYGLIYDKHAFGRVYVICCVLKFETSVFASHQARWSREHNYRKNKKGFIKQIFGSLIIYFT